MKVAGRTKIKPRIKSAVVLDPKGEMAAVTKSGRAVRKRISVLNELGFFLPPAGGEASQEKWRHTILKTELAELETPK